MSRTRKDRPFWVRSNDPTEKRKATHFQRRLWTPASERACSDGCTIDSSVYLPRRMWGTDDTPCCFMLDVSHNYQNTPSREDRRELFHGPIRAAERAYASRMVAAYNSGQDEDDEDIRSHSRPNLKTYWNW